MIISTEVTNFDLEFNLILDTSVNAFCMPGGKVVVFEGILRVTKDESGLAVSLVHEIAHVVAKHSNEHMNQQMLLQYGTSITVAFFGRLTFSNPFHIKHRLISGCSEWYYVTLSNECRNMKQII